MKKQITPKNSELITANENKIVQLAYSGLSDRQIAAYLNIELSELLKTPELAAAATRGRTQLSIELLSEQIRIAKDSTHRQQATMLIHLGKTMLGQKESTSVDHTIDVVSYESLMDLVKEEY